MAADCVYELRSTLPDTPSGKTASASAASQALLPVPTGSFGAADALNDARAHDAVPPRSA